MAALGLAAFAGTLFCLRHRSPAHLLVLLAGFTLFAGAFFPVASAFVEPLSWRNIVLAPEADVVAVQAEYVAFGFGLLAAACVAFAAGHLRPRAHVEPFERERPARSDALAATMLLLCGAALYGAFVQRVGLESLSSRDDYADKYLRAVGLGPLAIGINVMIVACLWAEAGEVGPRLRRAFRVAGAAIAAWSLLVIAVRTNVVILGLGYAWILCVRRRIVVSRVRPAIVALAVCGWFGLELVSQWRGAVQEVGADRAFESIARNAESNLAAVIGGSEFSHPFLTALEVRMHEHEGALGGQSYLDAIPALAPLSLVPDRPLALAETFARTHYADLAERGGGTAFSLVAEAWWNGGQLVGALGVGFLAGLLLLALEAGAAARRAGVLSRTVPYLTFLCVIAHRSESAVLLKQVVAIGLPVLAVVIVVDLLHTVLVRRSAAAPVPEPS